MPVQYQTRAGFRSQVNDPDMVVEAEPVEEGGVQYMQVTYPKGSVVVMDDGVVFPGFPVWLTQDSFNERYEPITK